MKQKAIPGSFFDEEYFTAGTKSNYGPYSPGNWAYDLANMVWEYYQPLSVLDVGCAYGFVVDLLEQKGIPAFGFDISTYAVERANNPNVWVGDAAKVESYRQADLILATELPEHLTEEQARQFLRHAHTWGQRALLLIAMYPDDSEYEFDPAHEKDKSHITIRPVSWWQAEALNAGWKIAPATEINEDARSTGMGWNGRWLYLKKE